MSGIRREVLDFLDFVQKVFSEYKDNSTFPVSLGSILEFKEKRQLNKNYHPYGFFKALVDSNPWAIQSERFELIKLHFKINSEIDDVISVFPIPIFCMKYHGFKHDFIRAYKMTKVSDKSIAPLFLDWNGVVFTNWCTLMQKVSIPDSLLCVPKDGEYKLRENGQLALSVVSIQGQYHPTASKSLRELSCTSQQQESFFESSRMKGIVSKIKEVPETIVYFVNCVVNVVKNAAEATKNKLKQWFNLDAFKEFGKKITHEIKPLFNKEVVKNYLVKTLDLITDNKHVLFDILTLILTLRELYQIGSKAITSGIPDERARILLQVISVTKHLAVKIKDLFSEKELYSVAENKSFVNQLPEYVAFLDSSEKEWERQNAAKNFEWLREVINFHFQHPMNIISSVMLMSKKFFENAGMDPKIIETCERLMFPFAPLNKNDSMKSYPYQYY